MVAFGSSHNIGVPSQVPFVSCPVPILGADAVPAQAVVIGPFARQPYTTPSLFHVSDMSYAAISKPAVQAQV